MTRRKLRSMLIVLAVSGYSSPKAMAIDITERPMSICDDLKKICQNRADTDYVTRKAKCDLEFGPDAPGNYEYETCIAEAQREKAYDLANCEVEYQMCRQQIADTCGEAALAAAALATCGAAATSWTTASTTLSNAMNACWQTGGVVAEAAASLGSAIYCFFNEEP